MSLALGSASASITLDVSQMASAGAQAEGVFRRIDAASQASQSGVRSFGESITAMEKDIEKAGTALAAFGAGVGLALGLAANEFIGFEAAMRNVNSIAGLSDQALSDLGDSVQDLSSSVGQGPTQLAEGLYDIQSSGFEAAEGLNILEKASVAATAGMTDTGTSARAITAVLNAYGKGAEEAGNVSDVLFSIVDKGVITFEALANNMGQVLPVASALNVPFEQVAAALAQLTLNGISASQAETALAAAMRSAVNPTAELNTVMQQAGFASAELAIQTVGLGGYLQILMQASNGSSEALSTLLGTAEATTAVMALMNDGGAGLTAMMSEMGAAMSDGAYAQGVFNEQAKSTAFSLQQLGVAFQNLQVTIGAVLAPIISFGAQGLTAVINSLTAAFSSLPGPVQQAVAGISGFAAVLTVAVGGTLLMAPRIVETVSAFRRLREESVLLQRALTLLGRISPVLLALTAIGAIIGAGIGLWQKYNKNVDESAEAMKRLEEATQATQDIISRLNFSGNFKLAKMVKDSFTEVEEVIVEFNASIPTLFSDLDWFANLDFAQMGGDEFLATFADFFQKDVGKAFAAWAEETKVLGENTNAILEQALAGNVVTLNQYGGQIQEAVGLYIEHLVIDDADKEQITESLNSLFDLFSNPNIDASKLNAVIMGYVSELEAGTITGDQFNEKLEDLHTNLAEGNDIWGIYTESVGAMNLELADMSDTLSKLRLEGLGDVANDIKQVELAIEGAAGGWIVTNTVLDETTGRFITVTETMQLTEDQMKDLQVVGQGVMEALASGLYNNTALMNRFNEAMAADTPLERLTLLSELYQDLNRYTLEYIRTVENQADMAQTSAANFDQMAAAADNFGATLIGVAGNIALANSEALAFAATLRGLGEAMVSSGVEAAEKQAEAVQEFNDATIEWLANGENILSFLNSYIDEANVSAQRTIDWAMSMNQAASAMDSVLAIFGELDALGQRSETANTIAENLVGKPGEWAEIDEMLQRGEISLNEYNAALEAGYSIQQDNLQIQRWLNEIRADQLPLLARQQDEYENQIEALTHLNAEEQQRALYLQSSAGQAAVATQYSTAYAASLGEIPEDVATELIANAAQSDPILKDTLLSLGLIEEGADGTITVNFPDGPTVQETIIELTRSIDALIVAMGHVPPLHIDSNVKEVTDDVRDLVGQGWNASVGVEDNATGPIGAIGNGLDALDGTDAEPSTTLDDNATPVAELLGRRLEDLDGSQSDPVMNLSGDAIDQTTMIEQILANLDGGTTTHTVIIETQGALQDVGQAPDRGAPDAPAPQRPDAGAGNVGTGNPLAAPIVMPAIDTTLFDASVANLATSMQSLLTAVNATFVVAIPANILNGMIAGSTALYSQLVVWQMHFAANLQPLLTATNATFAVAIPANVTTGMASATSTIYGNLTQWQAHFGANTQAVLTVVNAVFVTAIPANVSAGMSAATANVQSGVSQWPGIVSSVAGAMESAGYAAGAAAGDGAAAGLRSRLGAVQAAASQIAATVASALATSLLIASPSKVTTRLGEYAGEGLAVGLLNRESEVESAASRLGEVAARSMREGWSQAEDGSWNPDSWWDSDTYRELTGRGKGKWYDPRAGGNQGGSPLDPEPGNGGGTGTPTTPETPDPDAWAKANLKGLIILDEQALKNAGLKADTTVGSIFSKEEVDAGLTLKDLFAGRVRIGESDFMFGDYLEHYGGLIPDESIAPYPPGTTPPGSKPPGRPGSGGVSVEYGQVRPRGEAPNQPNRGSGRGGYDARGTTIYQIDSRQYNELRSGELEKIISDGERGNAAWGTMASGGLRRAQAYGPSRRVVGK